MELKLEQEQIDIWQTSVDVFTENNAISELTPLLTDTDKAEIAAIKNATKQRLKLVSRAFLRAVLVKYCDLAPTEIQFARALHGKPSIANEGVDIKFNLSHTDNFIACVVSKSSSVGVDVEKLDNRKSLTNLTKGVFSAAELKEFEQLDGCARTQYFFDKWTLKESLVKANGKGLTTKLTQVSFDKNSTVANLSVDGCQLSTSDNSKYSSWLWSIAAGYRLAVTRISSEPNNSDMATIRNFYFLPTMQTLAAEA